MGTVTPRLAAAYAGLNMDNLFVTDYEKFTKLKNSHLPFGQLPALQVTDIKTQSSSYICQTASILRFIGKISLTPELYPSDPITTKYVNRFGFTNADEKLMNEVRTNIIATVIPRYLKNIENIIKEGETGWIAGTVNPTIADFQWCTVLMAVREGWYGYPGELFTNEKYPILADLVERM